MRIIAGKYGGRVIQTPHKSSIHPMGERIRGAIFNSLFGQLDEAVVLDAFAGSGAIGIEALSRGAKRAFFIDNDRLAVKVIKENLSILGIDDQAEVVPTTILNWLKNRTSQQKFDIIFADPPYHDLQHSSVQALSQILEPNGVLILSNPKSAPRLEIPGLALESERVYADAKISWWRRG